jgi:transposase-like protein
MEEYPKTTREFSKSFQTEEACREYVFKIRWPEGFICPRCGHGKSWPTQRGQLWCCKCSAQTSVTAGTIFQDSRIPLRIWFEAIWHVVSQKQGINAKGLQRILGLRRYATTWTLLHKLRIAMVCPGRDRLGGSVQADEAYIGGPRPGKQGRGAEGKTLVLIAAEDRDNRIGRIRLRKIKDASGQSLIPAVKESVEPNSEICTDGWGGYNELPSAGYQHKIIRKTAETGENLLPLAHRVVALLKRWLLGTHQGAVRASHLDYYLDEFVFRFNRRTSTSRGLLFYRLIQQAVIIGPVKAKDIRGRQ